MRLDRLRKPFTYLALGLPALLLTAVLLEPVLPHARLVAAAALPGLVLAGALWLVALALRAWRTAAGLAGLAVVLLATTGSTGPVVEGGAARPVRVWFGNLWARNTDLAAMAGSIAAADADVVVLLEVTPAHAQALPHLLAGLPHVLRPLATAPQPAGPRLVIGSRWPLGQGRVELDGGFARAQAVVATPAGELALHAAHLTRPWPFADADLQASQLAALARQVQALGAERALVVGDFNAPPSTDLVARFAQQTGLVSAPAWPGTWPAVLPGPLRMTLDNALVGRGWRVVGRRLAAPTGSDHRAVVVEVVPGVPADSETGR